MPALLHISVSARGGLSQSRRYGERLAARLRGSGAVSETIRRDLHETPLPHPGAEFVRASLMRDEERTEADRAALIISEQLIGEIERASTLLIDTPMHNFTVPSALKAWIDHVVRPRRTFRSTPEGKVGLLADRPVYLIIACGGPVGNGAFDQQDFITPYLRYVLGTIGLRSIESLCLDRLLRGPEELRHAEDQFDAWILKSPASLPK